MPGVRSFAGRRVRFTLSAIATLLACACAAGVKIGDDDDHNGEHDQRLHSMVGTGEQIGPGTPHGDWELVLAHLRRLSSAFAGWYRRTPPADRVTWGGMTACAGLGIAVILERLARLRSRKIVPDDFTERFLDRLHDGRLDCGQALDHCEQHPSPAVRVAIAAVRRWGRPAGDLERAVAMAHRVEADRLRRNVGTLRRVAAARAARGSTRYPVRGGTSTGKHSRRAGASARRRAGCVGTNACLGPQPSLHRHCDRHFGACGVRRPGRAHRKAGGRPRPSRRRDNRCHRHEHAGLITPVDLLVGALAGPCSARGSRRGGRACASTLAASTAIARR